jgi:hypothetical protein
MIRITKNIMMMSDESKNNERKPEDEISDKADELIEKGKELADKAEDIFAEKVNKVKSSEAFEKISGFFDKVEDFMEEKADEFQKGEMGAKIEAFTERTGNQASELLKKVKETGLKIGDQVDDTLDAIKMKKDRTKNQDGAGI